MMAELRPIPSIWGHRAGNPVLNPEDAAFIDRAVRWAAPTPAAKIAQPRRSYRAVPETPRPDPHPIAKHNPPKRADNQIDGARVLEVRIHLAPADSQCLDGIRVPSSRSQGFPRVRRPENSRPASRLGGSLMRKCLAANVGAGPRI